MANGEKLLAEWFWVDRWMGSSAFALPIDARGLYREMLSQAWRRQARLPNDHDQIRRLTGVTLKEWRRTWPLVERFWRVDGDSLVNDTQLVVFADAQARQEKARGRAMSGAAARWGDIPRKGRRSEKLAEARAISTHTDSDWDALLAFIGPKCLRCSSTVDIVKDHIRPLALGGSDGIENLQPLCLRCNSSKASDVTDYRLHIDGFKAWLKNYSSDAYALLNDCPPSLSPGRNTPPTPLTGGRITKAERKHATAVRNKRLGCIHDPRHETVDECVEAIALAIREKAS